MANYAIGIKPLMDRLEGTDIEQEWFADEVACLMDFYLSRNSGINSMTLAQILKTFARLKK